MRTPQQNSGNDIDVTTNRDILQERKYMKLVEWPQVREIALDVTKLQVIFAESDPKNIAKVSGKAEISEKNRKERSLLWLDVGTKREKYRLTCGLNYLAYPSLDAKPAEKKVLQKSYS